MNEKIKKFWEENKGTIKTIVKVAAGVAITVAVGKAIKKSFSTVSYTPKPIDIPIPKKPNVKLPTELVDMGFVEESVGPHWIEFSDWCAIDPDHTIDDMHKAIDLIPKISGFDENARVQAMFNVYKINMDE